MFWVTQNIPNSPCTLAFVMTTPSVSSSSIASSSSASASTSRTYYLFNPSIKLDTGNYLFWESIVLPLIEGNLLVSHINGTEEAPARVISDGNVMLPNPAFQEWFQTDQILVQWLRSTMTSEIGAQLLHCQTARDLWVSARDLIYASVKSRVRVLKSELYRTRKNGMNMEDYLIKMKSISDQLEFADAPVGIDDLILHTLNGLDADYNAVVANLICQRNLTWMDTRSALLDFEGRLEYLNRFSSLSIQPSANTAQRGDDSDLNRSFSERTSWRGSGSRRSRGRRGGYGNW